ncbi:MAG: cysteine desulfurase [Eubacterium sp.]|nr:cysteine desulfurase [Eubacterium sp.]
MEVYLDNAATTRTIPEVAELVKKVMTEDYGNPSSLHGKGFEAEKYIRNASEIIAASLKVKPSEIVFTSGGTESNNNAITGVMSAGKRDGKHMITSVTEHPSVTGTCKYLEQSGYEVTYLDVDEYGRISEDELKKALRPDTVMVSVMTVNNEVGTIQDIQSLCAAVKAYDQRIVFHTDAVQAYGKIEMSPGRWGVDMMSVSAHKFHGPKGTGFLYIKEGTRIHPLIHGGGQQKDRRSGTENVPGIAGLGLAAKLANDNIRTDLENISKLKEKFVSGLSETDGVVIHGSGFGGGDLSKGSSDREERIGFSPYIISIGIRDVRAEVLLHALEEKGVYVSSGSACSSNRPGISRTLKGMQVDKAYLDSTIRLSLSRFTSSEELDYTLDCLRELIPGLRRFVRK